jgi:pimeloyl-ACP methyl ester carboxylesterase
MQEYEVVIPSAVDIAGALCVPDALPAPAVILLGGSGADNRDGDLVLESNLAAPAPGTLRQIAHHLAGVGVGSLRWDRRGFGSSGGDRAHVDYGTDLEDALACLRWLQDRPEVDAGRVAVAGHSAGALITCRVCRDAPDVAGAALLGALSSPIEDMLRWNVGRLQRHWDDFTDDQRTWLTSEMPRTLVRSEGLERLLQAARQGEPAVRLEGYGVVVDLPTARLRQDLETSYEGEMRHVRCPALVLHGGDDLNVPVEDALRSYRSLRAGGNDDVELVILPGLEHYFCPVAPDPARRIWERITMEAVRRPMAPQALDVIGRWDGPGRTDGLNFSVRGYLFPAASGILPSATRRRHVTADLPVGGFPDRPRRRLRLEGRDPPPPLIPGGRAPRSEFRSGARP